MNKQNANNEQDDMPMGGIILTLMPMVWLFWFLIERGLCWNALSFMPLGLYGIVTGLIRLY